MMDSLEHLEHFAAHGGLLMAPEDMEALKSVLGELRAARELEKEWTEEEEPLPEDAEIAQAHPLKTGRHDLYAEAMRLVGAKRGKGALVGLVNWLLHERDVLMDKTR